ncbi:MAG: hypothetical protein FWB75_05840 [Oscillospiraceae bacterium]|nr:hypothetical protein [Oscillospiraceae bacterium]
MRRLNRAIDKFCLKHRRFGIPRLMLYIIFVSALVFLFGGQLIPVMEFRPALILRGEVWRLLTWVFVPVNRNTNIFFMAITFYFYYFISSTLESEWGTAKFTVYYLSGVALHIIYGLVMFFVLGRTILIAPIYLNLSMFFAFAVLFPNNVVRLFFFIPIKIKWLAIFNAAFFGFSIVSEIIDGRMFMAILPAVALLNFFIICGGDLLDHLRPVRARASPQTINFQKEAKKVKREQAGQPYRHKCAVCGKTDTQFPDMEFRYCSRCNGYHCFCSEHINNHVHFD